MIDQSVYSVRPNSTVVIRDSSSIFGGTNVRVALDDGQIMSAPTISPRTPRSRRDDELGNAVEVADGTRVSTRNPNAAGGEIRISRGTVETSIGGERSTINSGEVRFGHRWEDHLA
jgi:hypothetical protein